MTTEIEIKIDTQLTFPFEGQFVVSGTVRSISIELDDSGGAVAKLNLGDISMQVQREHDHRWDEVGDCWCGAHSDVHRQCPDCPEVLTYEPPSCCSDPMCPNVDHPNFVHVATGTRDCPPL
jgi:hypothetical protein